MQRTLYNVERMFSFVTKLVGSYYPLIKNSESGWLSAASVDDRPVLITHTVQQLSTFQKCSSSVDEVGERERKREISAQFEAKFFLIPS